MITDGLKIQLLLYSHHQLKNPMTKYEVRVQQTHVDYYHVDAESEEDAQYKIKSALTTACKKVDTILRLPVLDYALKLDDNEEVTFD